MNVFNNDYLNENQTVNKSFKYAELFAGVGGFRVALDEIGGECVFASEIDKFARQSYEALYGHVPSGDITQINAEDIPDHDVLVGGFPCQAFSVAGKRGGFEDTRGTLIYDVVRILKAKQPKAALLENVKGLISHSKGQTLDTIVKIINEAGYRVDFQVLNSKYFGVPQNRERIFIVCIREDLIANEAWHIVGTNVVAKGKKRISNYEDVKTFNFDYPTNDTVEFRLRDFLEDKVSDKYYLDEDKTAQLVAQLDERGSKEVVADKPNKIAGLYGTSQAGSMWAKDGLSPTLDTAAGGYREPIIEDTNEISTVVDGFPPSVGKDDVSRAITTRTSAQYTPKDIAKSKATLVEETTEIKAVLTPDRVSKAQNGRRIKDNDEEMFTLTATDQHGVAEVGLPIRENTKKGYALAQEGDAVNFEFPNSKTRRGRVGADGQAQTLIASGVNQGVVTPTYRIRKLTPKECWRLQGFTDAQHDAVENAGVSNSQRYKQAGNAVTVNVIHALGQKLLPYI